ncbi:MAG: type II toxin-antitoxin system VapC family toxin [Stigonema ocellatum SAG 48.90 = DSM 106950]|nr:type II toxin-antitoxin system VapC family toxin [Stigonema ocellatum SAG 48.90 = DSM 106950]
MTKVFVDTAAWIALLNVRDTLHLKANQAMDKLLRLKTPLVTTEFVLLEVADALCATNSRSQTVAFINRLQLLDSVQIIPVSQKLLDEGWMLYSQRADKDWGLTDCISFVVMTQEGITLAFTSDRHFEQAGFVKLL